MKKIKPFYGEIFVADKSAAVIDEFGNRYPVQRRNLCGALHGDFVRAERISRGEAVVTEILRCRRETLAGRYTSGGEARFIPDDRHFPIMRVLKGRAKENERVLVRLLRENRPACVIIDVLGEDEGLADIIRSFELYSEFPSDVTREAENMPDTVSEAEAAKREDFRSDTVFTIDGEDSKDFDDAVCVKKIRGNYRLYVHIADVAHYVKANSPSDKEAFKRGTSVYFPSTVLPMLHENLSNGICSLNEGVDRLTLSVVMDVDTDGTVVKSRITEGVIRSAARLTYTEAQRIIDGDKVAIARRPSLATPLKNMYALYKILSVARTRRGAIEFESAETEFDIVDGKVVDARKRQRTEAHMMIEEFMIAANRTVAQTYDRLKIPFVYRAHMPPPAEKLEKFRDFIHSLGLSFDKDSPSPKDFRDFLDSVPATLREVVDTAALRSMSKAEYSVSCRGHYGLNLRYYCHFTSPIRRYPDLMIHRVIKAHMRGGSDKAFAKAVKEAATRSSARERLAEEAERRADDLFMAQFMSEKIGEEFCGVISGVTERGFFVRLDFGAEGFVLIEKLDGFYRYDERGMALRRGSKSYRLGQKTHIRVAGVSGDRIAFDPLE